MSEPTDVETQLPAEQADKVEAGGEPSKPTRVSKKRTKTGCLTCRKRRIKCGEERPTCNNCVKSKRNCEGYSQRVVFKLGSFGNEEGQIDGIPYYGFPDQMPYLPGTDPTLPYALQAARGNMNLQRIAPAPFVRRQFDENLPENQLHTTLPPHLQYYMGSAQAGRGQTAESHDGVNQGIHSGNIPAGFPPQDPDFLQRSRSAISPIDTGIADRRSASLVSPSHPVPLSATESHWPASATSTTYPTIEAGYRHSYGHDSGSSVTSPTGLPLESPTYRAPITTAPSHPSNVSEVSPRHFGYNPYEPGFEPPHGYPGPSYHPDHYAAAQFKREPSYEQHRFQDPVNAQEQQGQWPVGDAAVLNATGDTLVESEEEYSDDDDDDDDLEYENDEVQDDDDVLMELDAIPRQTIATAITPYAQSNENTRLTFRSFLPEAGTLMKYSPASGASPLSNPTTARIFCHWVYVVAPSLSIFERHPANPHQAFAPGTRLNGPQNIWCYTIPTMSLSSPLLLHAMLAVASFHIAKLSDEPITSSYVHYHFSLRRLRKAISDDKERASVTTLAGTLLLAYYETMAADVRKWSSHLQGAKNLLKEIDFENLNRRMEILEDEELAMHSQNSAFDGMASIRNRKLQKKGKAGPDSPPSEDPIRKYILGSRERRKMSQAERARVVNAKTSNARGQEIALLQSDLFWFFAKQDAYQAMLSGEGLVLDYAHWGQCPPRPRTGTLGTSYGSMDYLYLLYGRIADFQARDAKRKAEQEKYGPAPAIIELMKSMGAPPGGGQPGGGPPPGWKGGPPPGWKGGPPPGWQGGPPPGWQGGPPTGIQGGPSSDNQTGISPVQDTAPPKAQGGPPAGFPGGPPPGWQGGPPPGWQGGPPPGWKGGPPSKASAPGAQGQPPSDAQAAPSSGIQGGPPPGWQGGPPPGWTGGPPPGIQGGPPLNAQGESLQRSQEGPPPGMQGGPPPGWTGGPPPGWQGGPPPGWTGGLSPDISGPPKGISPTGVPPSSMPPPSAMSSGGPSNPPSSGSTDGPPSVSPTTSGTENNDQSAPLSANSGPKMPPVSGNISRADLDAMTVEAELEWKEIYQALLLFQESLGDEFQPLEAELMPVQASPFGDAIYYRTYSVSCLQALYKTAHILLERFHPSMPSNGWVAAGIAARKTAALSQEMGRISAGLFPPLEATEISPPLGGALIEMSFCMMFAGVQYQDSNQREWLLDHLYNVGKMTGWGTANRCALGCEHAWEKMHMAGRGPPHKRREESKREFPIPVTQDTPNYVFMGSANKAHWATGLLGPMETQMGNMTLGSN